jgi:leucyl-tRNA---protein transferase
MNDNSSDTKQNKIDLYVTPAHNCPYIEKQSAKTLFISPEIEPNEILYSWLIDRGFRRSGDHIYRPQCENCKQCISVRVNCENFIATKQQKRCLTKARRFTMTARPAFNDDEHYRLFELYINTRHADGDMYPTSLKQYQDFILCQWMNTQFLDFYDPITRKLVACSVFDQMQQGLSAIYTFFDPEYSKYSLGRLAILKLIEQAKQSKLAYIYLGYWIKNCKKMSYKGEYRPIECFVNDEWVRLT